MSELDLNAAAEAVVRNRWGYDAAPWIAHIAHSHSASCAVCTGDVHQILAVAAPVIEAAVRAKVAEELRPLFDLAVSYIHAADCPDNEEVETLRGFALQLGVDPLEVTPYPNIRRYPHRGEPNGWVEVRGVVVPRACKRCYLPISDPIHDATGGTS